MSRKFLTNIDLNSNELRNGVIHNLATDPAGKAGQLYYNTADNELKYYDGGASAWVSLTSVDAEVIEDAVAELLAAGSGIGLDYNDVGGTLTISNTGVTSVSGTSNEVEVSASVGAITIGLPSSISVDVTGDLTGNADTATELATARTISLGGSLSGSVSFDGSQDVTITADIVADSVALGTDTTGDYVAGASASGAGISVTGSGGEGSTLTIENTGVTSVAGTGSQISVSGSTGAVTISLPSTINVDTTGNASTADNADSADTVKTVSAGNADANYYVTLVDSNNGSATSETVYTDDAIYYNPNGNKLTVNHFQVTGNADVDGDLIVDGNLTVSGSVTALNTETLLVEDNIVVLNSNVTGTPSADAGIEVERGSYTNTSLYWDESENKWTVAVVGDNTNAAVATGLSLEGHGHSASAISDFNSAVDDEIDAYLVGSDSISITSGSIDATLAASNSYLTKTGGLAVDKSSLESALVSDGFPKKYAVGNGSLTSTGGVCTWTVTHNLGTKDVTVQVYEVAADYAQVEVDVQHTSTSAVTLKINSGSTITADTYRVVVIG